MVKIINRYHYLMKAISELCKIHLWHKISLSMCHIDVSIFNIFSRRHNLRHWTLSYTYYTFLYHVFHMLVEGIAFFKMTESDLVFNIVRISSQQEDFLSTEFWVAVPLCIYLQSCVLLDDILLEFRTIISFWSVYMN